jgi:hypothetical protein
VGRGRKPRNIVDDYTEVRCASGTGVIREEVWEDELGQVVKYNLAFIHPLYTEDNGRVLGYDNAHGVNERHYKGKVQEITYAEYDALLERFLAKVRELRRKQL